MCGIAGIITGDRKFPLLQSIRTMTDVLRHRGPDDEGYLLADVRNRSTLIGGGKDTPKAVYRSPLPYAPKREMDALALDRDSYHLAFGHRRLSIIDLSPAGHQPMCNKNGTLWVVYNGEIYNYLELRAELESFGYTFQSNADTEVLLTAYEHWGVGALNRFVGMFAFAILDMPRRKLFVARDFFGIKPLYYSLLPEGFAFASEIKALIELRGVTRRVNPQRLYDYLRLSLTDYGGETLFADVMQLPAAHYLEIPADGPHTPRPVRYWDIGPDPKSPISYHEAANMVRDLFLDNVRLHLRSDVPVGSALSGGIDSSSIVMAMQRMPEQTTKLHTFSYIADPNDLSEERWVDLVGASSRVSVHKIRLGQEQLIERLDSLVYTQDEPFLSTSICAQNSVFMFAHQTGIKVMLDGQGADEIFGGYRSHLEARLASLLRNARFADAFRLLLAGGRLPGVQWWNLAGQALVPLLPGSTQNIARRVAGRQLAPSWLNLKWFAEREVLFHPVRSGVGRDIFRQQLHQTVSKTMLPMLLRYEDRNSMAFSIESRVPFLTPDLVNVAFSLPEEYLISKDGVSKAVFRSAMRGMVPDGILKRRDKIGFVTPEEEWLRALSSWCEKLLSSDTARRVPALNQNVIKKEWELFISGKMPFDSKLWRWLNLIKWVELHEVLFQ